MRYGTLLFFTLALIITSVSAQAIDTEDIPSACESACGPVIAASDACEEVEEEDEDASDWVCVCAAQGMSTAVPECLSCVQSAAASSDDDDDGGDIIAGLGSCGFSANPVSSAALTSAQAPASSEVGITATVIQTVVDTGSTAISTATSVVEDTGSQVTTSANVNPAGSPSSTAGLSQVGHDSGGSQTTTNANGNAAASPSTTAGPSHVGDAAPSDLEGSRLTVLTATIGSGDDAVLATLTSVVPGPVVTANEVEEQPGNGGVIYKAPVAAAALGFAAVLL